MRPSLSISNERFPALTGIRAVGAMAVFFVHLPFQLGYRIVIDVMPLFFVLSGFLIIYLYYENTAVRQGRLRNYLVNRFARIYPLYFLLVTIAIVLRNDFRPVFLFKNYTLTHALFYNLPDRAIQPSWSITVEECFYLLAPLIMYVIRKKNFMMALLYCCLLSAVALAISFAPVSLLHTPGFVFSVTFFGHFFEFFCGIFLALVILKKEKKGALTITGIRYSLTGAAGILLLFIFMLWKDHTAIANTQATGILVNNFLLPVPVAVLYYGLIREQSLLRKLLSARLVRWLGKTSYAFYLVHMIVIEAIAVPYILPFFKGYYNGYVLLVFVITQCIAWLLFVAYEEPVNNWLRKKCKREAQVPAIIAA